MLNRCSVEKSTTFVSEMLRNVIIYYQLNVLKEGLKVYKGYFLLFHIK